MPILDPSEPENQKPFSAENVQETLNLEIRFAERISMFSKAYETYEEHKEEWLKEHSGEYVVISASDVAGFFPSVLQAYNAGRRRYGVGVFFLVMPINASEQLTAAYEFGGVKASSFKVRLNG